MDKDWKVLERTKFTAPSSQFIFRRQLQWSDNGQFVLYHHQIGFDYDNNWVGIWLDLRSGLKHEIEGLSFDGDPIAFTGEDGTWGIKAFIGKNYERVTGYGVFGQYMELRKPRECSAEVTWRWEEAARTGSGVFFQPVI